MVIQSKIPKNEMSQRNPNVPQILPITIFNKIDKPPVELSLNSTPKGAKLTKANLKH